MTCLLFPHTVLWLLMKSFDLFSIIFMSAASEAFLLAESTETYKWRRIKAYTPAKEILLIRDQCLASSYQNTAPKSYEMMLWKLHIQSLS